MRYFLIHLLTVAPIVVPLCQTNISKWSSWKKRESKHYFSFPSLINWYRISWFISIVQGFCINGILPSLYDKKVPILWLVYACMRSGNVNSIAPCFNVYQGRKWSSVKCSTECAIRDITLSSIVILTLHC